MNPIVFNLQGHLVLLIVDLSLKKLSVLRESHVFIFKWQVLKLLLQSILLNATVRKLVDKLVKIFSGVIVFNELVLT